MNKFWLVLLVVVTGYSWAEDQCIAGNQEIGARYLIAKGDAEPVQMTLWRRANQVLYQYEGQDVVDLWERTPNGQVRLIRLFDHYQRGIEYQPGEVAAVKPDWEVKRVLVAASLREQMQLDHLEANTCEQEQHFSLNNDEAKIELTWLQEAELATEYHEQQANQQLSWTLVGVETDAVKVDQAFEQRLHYQMTDFIDIGDNESDPFLQQMINMGFVEHAHSGFYDAEGNPLESAHGHE